jgi:hypothetical protein
MLRDENEFERKHEKLIEMAQQLEEKLKEGFKKKTKDEGYFGKIMKKMIDNLQIKIRDVHVRIESQESKLGRMRYSIRFGLTEVWESQWISL